MSKLLLTFLASWGLFAHVAHANDPLPAKEVFKPEVSQILQEGQYQTTLKIDFPAGYYLYTDKTNLTGMSGKETRPPSKIHDDPYLGKVKVWETPPTITIVHAQPASELTLTTQGCQENVICYPPTTWQIPIPQTEPQAAKPSKSLFTQKNTLLDERDAFQVAAEPTNGEISVQVNMPDGYYTYRNSFAATVNGEKVALNLPQGEIHHDEFLGEQEIYRHSLQFSLAPPASQQERQNLVIHFQGCAEGRVCYPPIVREFSFPMEVSTVAPRPNHASTIETISDNLDQPSERGIINRLNDNFLLALPFLLLLGIGVSFTACIYPLVPIVTSLVVGKNTTTGRAYRLVSTYVLAMGGAMGLLGAVFGIFEINLQLIFQKPWIAALVALLFVGLALSLFDVYTLQTPRWLQKPVDKITRQQQSGSYLGAAVMGALSVLVVSPCATPILTALLLFTTQTTPLKGALALFFFGLGTGLPLFLFAGAFRQFMPKAGGWMDNIKKIFAFALLGIAAYLITRIMPLALAFAAWALYALFAAVYWFDANNKKRLFFSGVALLIAIALAVQSASSQFSSSHALTKEEITTSPVHFQPLNQLAEIEQALARSDKPVIVDFYADWCISCKKWERNIWQNARFFSTLQDYTLLKIDVTDFKTSHKAIFQRLELVGPPAVLIYPPHGQLNQPIKKIIGEQTADQFAALLTELPRK